MINKHIIGLKITTTNENNQAQEDLAQLWKSFYDQANAELQTVKKEPYTYVVYTNYQWDFQQGNYDCYLGVASESTLTGFASCDIKLEKYQIFDFPYYSPQDTFEARKTIRSNQSLKRAYLADLEIYDFEHNRLQIIISTLED